MDESTAKGGKGMRRVPINKVVPLRVSNRRDSLGIEGFSSVAPPCYSSQRGAASSVVTYDGPRGENGSEFGEEDDDASVSVHSCPELGQDDVLPSPYSTEDLLQGYTAGHPRNDHMHPAAPPSTHPRSCVHGYTHIHSQCTRDITHASDSHTVDQHNTPIAVVTGSAFPPVATPPYSHHSHRGKRFPSPRPTLYHHYPMSSPSAVGHLTYQGPKPDHERHYKSQDNVGGDAENTSRPPASTDSNLTCLPEDAAAHHRLYEFDAKRNRFAQDRPEVQRSSHASNFVSLSRKSTLKKPAFFQQVAYSSITGKFTIDPSLRIPSSLLNAIKPLSLTGMDSMIKTSTDLPDTSSKRLAKAPITGPAKTHRKNLVLEVENGGIDVDVCLVPSAKRTALNSDSLPPPGENDKIDAGTPQNFYVEHRRSYRRPGCMVSSKPLFLPQSPTLLDLRLREVKICPARSSFPKKGREFPLMARILAPNPRPPFHLFASTIIAPCSISEPAIEESDQSPSPPSAVSVQPQRGPSRRKNRARIQAPLSTRTLSRSPVTLQLPRTFRGPLTVHVAAGDLDAHIHLSRELAETVMVLAESAFSRGYFVGQLASWGERREDSADDWVVVDDEVRSLNGITREEFGHGGKKRHIQRESEDEAMRGHSVGAGLAGNEDKHEDEEWSGDKVDVVVGNGKVYLQFLDEEDPFGKTGGFWYNIGLGCR